MFPRAGFHAPKVAHAASCERTGRTVLGERKEASMVPLLLWILGVPGLIIILLLLLGIVHI